MDDNTWADPDNFSLVLRSTTAEYARQFLERGQIKFSTPLSWVEYAEKYGEGRGDFYEGTIAFAHFCDIEQLQNLNKKYENLSDLNRILHKERILFKSNKNMLLPCFCFYTLKNSMFLTPETDGIHKLKTTIPPEYFRDFFDHRKPEEVESLDEKTKPSILTIYDFELFKERLVYYLMNIGVEKKDIIIGRVSYFNFEQYGDFGFWDFSQKPPMELLVKGKRFTSQNEGRIIVNTTNKEVLKKLEKPVELGNMQDVALASDRYFYEGIKVELKANVEKKSN